MFGGGGWVGGGEVWCDAQRPACLCLDVVDRDAGMEGDEDHFAVFGKFVDAEVGDEGLRAASIATVAAFGTAEGKPRAGDEVELCGESLAGLWHEDEDVVGVKGDFAGTTAARKSYGWVIVGADHGGV